MLHATRIRLQCRPYTKLFTVLDVLSFHVNAVCTDKPAASACPHSLPHISPKSCVLLIQFSLGRKQLICKLPSVLIWISLEEEIKKFDDKPNWVYRIGHHFPSTSRFMLGSLSSPLFTWFFIINTWFRSKWDGLKIGPICFGLMLW